MSKSCNSAVLTMPIANKVCPNRYYQSIWQTLLTNHIDLAYECEEEARVWNVEKKSYVTIVRRGVGIAVFKATVSDGKGGVATGYKSEKACSFPDWIEKSETGAIGRALAALGYGTQFAPELNEEHCIVDSPIDRSGVQQTARQLPPRPTKAS